LPFGSLSLSLDLDEEEEEKMEEKEREKNAHSDPVRPLGSPMRTDKSAPAKLRPKSSRRENNLLFCFSAFLCPSQRLPSQS